MHSLRPFIAIVPLLFAACGEKPSAAVNAPAGPKPYTLTTCIVSGEELGSMGDPITLVHDGQEIKLCCDSCLPKFKKDPAKYVATLHGGARPADSDGHSGHNH